MQDNRSNPLKEIGDCNEAIKDEYGTTAYQLYSNGSIDVYIAGAKDTHSVLIPADSIKHSINTFSLVCKLFKNWGIPATIEFCRGISRLSKSKLINQEGVSSHGQGKSEVV
jgi:hypothetical protein